MRSLLATILITLFLSGCQGRYEFEGPKVDNFDGQLTTGESPVEFEEGQKVVLRMVFLEDGQSFGIPIKSDGSFDIGWMPIGKYSAILEYDKANKSSKGASSRVIRHNVPEGFEVVEGQTQYTIDLGTNFKP